MLFELIKSLLKDAIGSVDSMISDSITVLSGGGAFGGAWSTVQGWSNMLKPFCNIVIGICLLIEIAQVASKVDIIKWEHGLKLAIKATLAKVAIDITPTFLRACYNQAGLWIGSVGGSAPTIGGYVTSTDVDNLVDAVNSGLGFIDGIVAGVGLLASTLLVIMAIKICGLLVQVIAYGRMFEIYVYLMVSPFPMAFFPLGNGHGDGISRITQRFVKSFIAVCLQGVMILVCMRIFDTLMGTVLTNAVAAASGSSDPSVGVSNLCYSLLMGCIVLVMSVARCGTWAKGIIDAM